MQSVQDPQRPSATDRLWGTIKNNLVIAVLIVGGGVVIGVAQLTGAVDDLITFVEDRIIGDEAADVNSGDRSQPGQPDTPACEGAGAGAAVQAFAVSQVYPDSLPQFVVRNATLFASDGPAIRCLTFLMEEVVSLPITRAEQLAGFEMRLDPLGITPSQFATGTSGDHLDLAASAQDFGLLAEILPRIAQGDSAAYRETTLYQLRAALWADDEAVSQLDPTFARLLSQQRHLTFEVTTAYGLSLIETLRIASF